MRFSLLLLAVSAAMIPLQASCYDGNELHKDLLAFARINQGSTDTFDRLMTSHVMGYVSGETDTLITMGKLCIGEMKVGQQVAIVKKYVDDNPTRWNEFAYVLIADSFARFACKQVR